MKLNASGSAAPRGPADFRIPQARGQLFNARKTPCVHFGTVGPVTET
jgi:hypothetical protein